MRLCSLVLLACLLVTGGARAGEPAHRPYRIMMLLYRGATEAEQGFRDYFKRRHIAVDYIVRDAQADRSRIAGFVREARALQPDLIYTFGTTVTAEVAGLDGAVDPARHITTIPIVFDIVADPVGAGLVRKLSGSGRNLTGASHLVPLAAQLQALQAMRGTQSLGVLYNPQEKNSALALQELERLAPRFKLTVHAAPVAADSGKQSAVDAIAAAMQSLQQHKVQFIYLPSDSFMIKNARIVVQLAQAAHLPVFAATEAPIRDDGALLGLVSNYFNVGELAARKAEQILGGKADAAGLPIESLNRYTYLVNMGAARKLHLYPPLSVIKFAELVAASDSIDARE
ncbi:MAG: ABC transporter substrate-binding protein [Pseudomonadota bacterium]